MKTPPIKGKIASKEKDSTEIISNRFVNSVCELISGGARVRRTLPIWGRLHIDRQLPFLCVYRNQSNKDDFGTHRFVTGEASYLTISSDRKLLDGLQNLIIGLVKVLKANFGAFLIVEIWTRNEEGIDESALIYNPAFRIYGPKSRCLRSTLDVLATALSSIKIADYEADVEIVHTVKPKPPGLPALLSPQTMSDLQCNYIGLEIKPIHIDQKTGEGFPMVRRVLQRRLSRAHKRCFFEFTRSQTTLRPKHYLSLGRRSMVKVVWEIDERIAEVGDSFDFLLHVTPINTEAAWAAFKRKKCDSIPDFVYRRLPVDPLIAKRRLHNIPIERIEDPTLLLLFREQQIDLDRKLTLLLDRETPRFLHGSIQLYGGVEPSLFRQAKEILRKFSSREIGNPSGKTVDASTFASRAVQEIEYFRKSHYDISATVTINDEISGLLVSQGNLFIGNRLKVPASRMEALVQHEIGTHVLTYWNGRAQPFKQLYVGLSGYDELQEGLAVLAEYFVDGLTGSRLRLLAGRVVAVHRMVDGISFVDVFRELNKTYRFKQRVAFNIALRVFRGGGLTKDAVYLRGLINLLKYLGNGGDLETLYVGKFSASHVAIVKELQYRRVLVPPPLRPRYLNSQRAIKKLDRLRAGVLILDLVKRSDR